MHAIMNKYAAPTWGPKRGEEAGRSRSHVVSAQGMEVKLREGRDGYEVRWSFGSLGVTDQNWTSNFLKMLPRRGEGGRGLVSCRIVSCRAVRERGIWTATFYWQKSGRETEARGSGATRDKDKDRTQMPGCVRREVHRPRRVNST
jgi:hypothetical protein